MHSSKLDLKALGGRARASPDGEAYHPLLRVPSVRVGVVARDNANDGVGFLIEVCICASRGGDEGSALLATEHSLNMMKECARMGYRLTYEDNCCSTFEKAVARRRLLVESRALLAVLGEESP